MIVLVFHVRFQKLFFFGATLPCAFLAQNSTTVHDWIHIHASEHGTAQHACTLLKSYSCICIVSVWKWFLLTVRHHRPMTIMRLLLYSSQERKEKIRDRRIIFHVVASGDHATVASACPSLPGSQSLAS